jgi:hypothetical protein
MLATIILDCEEPPLIPRVFYTTVLMCTVLYLYGGFLSVPVIM